MNNIDFTQGKLLPKMIKFSLPMILSIVLQALYGAVDMIVVGKYGNSAAQAAVATGAHVMQTITGIVTGFTMGITVVIGRFVGAKENKKIGTVIGNVTIIFTLFSLVITAILLGTNNLIIKLLQVPEEAVEMCYQYILICSIGFIFVVAYNVISGFFRGIGNSNLPLVFIGIACLINVVLDIIFVKVCNMYASGAAIATVVAQIVSVLCSVFVMYKKRTTFQIEKSDFKLNKPIVKNIFKIGLPIALQDFLTNFSFLVIHSFINGMGLIESAGIGISEKLFVILSIVPMSYMTVMATVVSQNEGAGEKKRSKLALIEGCTVSFTLSLIPFFLTYFGGDLLAKIFSNDEAVIKVTAEYLQTCSFEYLLIAIAFCFMGFFNGKGKSIFVMSQSLASTFLCRIPMSYVFSQSENASMHLMGIPVSVSAAVMLALCIMFYIILHFIENKKEKIKL